MTGFAETTTYAAARPVFEACGRRRRFFAALLDGIVLLVVAAIVGSVLTLAFDGSLESFGVEQSPGTTAWSAGGADLAGTALAISVVMTAITAVYFVAFHATTGQTPGKGMLGVKVVDIHTGEAPNLGTSILRYAIYAGTGLLAAAMSYAGPPLASFSFTMDLAWFVIVGWILFEKTRRGLHDIVAETAVVRTRPPGPEAYGGAAVGSGW